MLTGDDVRCDCDCDAGTFQLGMCVREKLYALVDLFLVD